MEVSKSSPTLRRAASSGYTLVEVLVGSSILMLGFAAACVMSLTMVTQEEMSHRMARALSVQENAARLFQLGIDPALINADNSTSTGLLPSNSDMSLSITAEDGTVTGVGTLEAVTITANIFTTENDSNLTAAEIGWTAGARRASATEPRAERTTKLTVYRSPLP